MEKKSLEDKKTERRNKERELQDLEEQTKARQSELEGEVLELAVEDVLRNLFPRDDIKDVKRGAYGADCEQTVRGALGTTCGKILWECKKHKLCFEKFSVKQEMLAHKAGCKFRCPKCDWSTGRSARVEGHLRVCK